MLLFFIFLFLITVIATCRAKLIISVNEKNNNIILYICTLGNVCLYKKNLHQVKKKTSSKRIKGSINTNKLIAKVIKSGKLNINEFNLKIDMCTADAVLTAYLVGIVSSIIGIIIKASDFRINNKKFFYEVQPIYTNQKVLNVGLKCIISKNLAHIMFIIYKSIKECKRGRNEGKNGGKSSN